MLDIITEEWRNVKTRHIKGVDEEQKYFKEAVKGCVRDDEWGREEEEAVNDRIMKLEN